MSEENLNQSVSITLENMSKHYGQTLVLQPFSLTLEAGCRTVLLGPSGCGKTTLLRIIAGLETPDAGSRVLIGGVDVTDTPVEKRRIGFMFQQYALFPHMTVEENIAYGLKVRHETAAHIDRVVSRMLSLVNLEKYRKRNVLALSGGQRQRVALARALAIRPKILLLDEPLSALDAQIRHKVREELAVILKELGITAVIVTHDQDEAMVLGDNIVVMEGGRIHQAASPQEVWDHPATPFVAGFVGGSNRTSAVINGDTLEWYGAQTPIAELPQESSVRLAGMAAGEKATVFFRADDASLVPEGETQAGAPVVVKDLHFMGNFVRVSVIPGEGSANELIKVNLQTLPAGMGPGARMRLVVPSERLMAFRN